MVVIWNHFDGHFLAFVLSTTLDRWAECSSKLTLGVGNMNES
jgi:hypothetical protein